MFEPGELRAVILYLLEQKPRHGYEFIRELETLTRGAYAPSPGVIYPLLTMLEDLGQVEASSTEGARKVFTLTEEGRTAAAESKREAEASLKRLQLLGDENAWNETGPVWRAMHNLKAALRQSLATRRDKDTQLQVADILDEAARKIERL
ncbi:PadR family transcriptional regulator [Myxococcus sp. K15C18031901]|uniref:PadR family transcriptional regulator n=1 Tax=Myxococcus dinghuensis TaxID=2906761 RepID=UPI0020A77EB0|nr:PadR family transcriptional regulator [Myxococcus dinghuensis]MCP3101957.1 PadR family transcriptional regulator [Myxococcus dinghuensis]